MGKIFSKVSFYCIANAIFRNWDIWIFAPKNNNKRDLKDFFKSARPWVETFRDVHDFNEVFYWKDEVLHGKDEILHGKDEIFHRKDEVLWIRWVLHG